LADDAVASRVLTSALLRRLGLHVHTAENGEQVVQLFQRYRYQLVLLDIDMPILDGVAAARQIRALDGLDRRTPIIAVSGFLSDAVRTDLQQVFDAGVAKPLNFDRLRRVMIEFVPSLRSLVAYYNAPQAAQGDCPLVDVAAGGSAPEVTIDRLRQAASSLNSVLASQDYSAIMQAIAELDHLSVEMAAPRLHRRAAAIANAAPDKPLAELCEQAQELLCCAVATIGELKKLNAHEPQPKSDRWGTARPDNGTRWQRPSGKLKLVS
jgi:CheY-like chemotaxis protein